MYNAEYNLAYKRASAEIRRKYGLCPQCGMADPMPGRALCEECTMYNRDYHKVQYERRKTAGICTVCGVSPASEGRTTCSACAARMRRYAAARRVRLRSLGVCIKCGKHKAMPGKPMCGPCSEVENARQRLYRAEKRKILNARKRQRAKSAKNTA